MQTFIRQYLRQKKKKKKKKKRSCVFFLTFSKDCFKRKQRNKEVHFDMKTTKKQQKTTKFLAANTKYGYKIALLKHNDNQTYTFELKKKKNPELPTHFSLGILQ